LKHYSDATYVILGILTTNCRSGYAIKQFIDQSLNHFWKISYGQIYPALKQIEQDGLAEVHTTANKGKPDKQEYFLTAKGLDTLKQWLEQPIKQMPAERNEVLLKLFFGRYQKTENVAALLNSYKLKLEKRYQTYVAIEQSINLHNDDKEDAVYWLLTLDYGKRVTKAAIEWCESALQQLLTKEDS